MNLVRNNKRLVTAGFCLFAMAGCDEADPQSQPAVQTTGGTILASGGLSTATGGLSTVTGGVVGTGGSLTGGIGDTGGTVEIGGTGGTGSANGDGGEWCEALAVFRESCQTCHGDPLVGAPMPIVTYADTQATSILDGTTPLVQRIGERVHDSVKPMPPVSQNPLTAAQIEAVDAWIAAGAPSAEDATCGGEPEKKAPADFAWPADCEEFHKLTANTSGAPYSVHADEEYYKDFFFDVPWGGQGPVQMLAYKPITDNSRVLHHWIVYEGNSFVAGWAPGGNAAASEDGVGMYLPTSGQLKMTTHYYNVGNNQAEPDASGLEICITRNLRPMTSAVFPFIAPSNAPAKRRTEQVDTCTVHLTDANQSTFLISSSPHMHQLGVAAKLEVIRTNGTVEVLHDRAFDFEDQLSYGFEKPVELNEGDRVRTTCVFQNDTSQNVTFGEGSYDEMCFNFMGYYPACGMTCTASTPFEIGIAASQGNGCPGGANTGGGIGWPF